MLKLRIHGDNILECERTLDLVVLSLATKPKYADSPIYAPIYHLMKKEEKLYGKVTDEKKVVE